MQPSPGRCFRATQKPGAHKQPLTENGFHNASSDPAVIRDWWCRWPRALIGVPTGQATGAVVLDVDVKQPEAFGYDTLDDLGFAILPETPMVHTASGGLHLYFAIPPNGLRNTGGARGRGIGPGLDWRGDGGYVIVPSPGSGYSWDPHWNFELSGLLKYHPPCFRVNGNGLHRQSLSDRKQD